HEGDARGGDRACTRRDHTGGRQGMVCPLRLHGRSVIV
ncbi:MAG: hypothetical protein AVDCRST_MAG28-2821, partial [uncultured Rubrobacteraceae bacterium]